MSKKISISIPDKIKPNLHELFHVWLTRFNLEKKNKSRNRHNPFEDYTESELLYLMSYGINPYDFCDDYDYAYPTDDDFDDVDYVFPSGDDFSFGGCKDGNKHRTKKKHNHLDDGFSNYVEIKSKKHKHKRGKSSKKIDIYTPYSGFEGDVDDESSDSVLIWYYPNYSNKDDRLEFNSLKEFDDFCRDEGFVISPSVAEGIAYRPVSHVCLMPESRERGVYELYAADSYADMAYEVCNIEELSQ